jgi:hypothetical protein
MTSLAKPERVRALQALGVWCQMELTGTVAPRALLESLNFDSVEVMQVQLTTWGLPDWLVYAKPPKPPREAKSSGGQEDLLPSREKAQGLPRPLVAALQYGVEQLDLRKEYRQGGRFVSVDVQPGSVLDAGELTRNALETV